MLHDENKRYVQWQTFVWALGILFVLFTTILTISLSAKADASSTHEQIFGIQTDITWIKNTLNEIKNDLKNNSK